MVTSIRLYFEGDPRLKPGFRQFLNEVYERARQNRCEVSLVATIADMIAATVKQIPAALIAVIIVKIGLRQFCQCAGRVN